MLNNYCVSWDLLLQNATILWMSPADSRWGLGIDIGYPCSTSHTERWRNGSKRNWLMWWYRCCLANRWGFEVIRGYCMYGWNISGVMRSLFNRCRCQQDGLIVHVFILMTNRESVCQCTTTGLWIMMFLNVCMHGLMCICSHCTFILGFVCASLKCVYTWNKELVLSLFIGTSSTSLATSTRGDG